MKIKDQILTALEEIELGAMPGWSIQKVLVHPVLYHEHELCDLPNVHADPKIPDISYVSIEVGPAEHDYSLYSYFVGLEVELPI